MTPMRFVHFKTLGIFVAVLICSSPLYALTYRGYVAQKKRLMAEARVSVLQTSANYESGGSLPLSGGKGYDLTALTPVFKYDFTNRLALRSELDLTFASTRGGSGKKNQGLSEARFQPQLTLLSGPLDFLVEGVFVAPFFRPTEATDIPMPGEGAVAFGANGIGIIRMDGFGFLAKAGYLWRDQGRSAQIHLAAGAEAETEPATVGVLFTRVTPYGQDLDPDLRRRVIDRANGGSYIYYSPEGSQTLVEGWADIPIGRSLELRVGGGSSLSGLRTANVGWFFTGLRWDTFSETRYKDRKLRQSNPDVSDSFVIDRDQTTDDSVFDDPKSGD